MKKRAIAQLWEEDSSWEGLPKNEQNRRIRNRMEKMLAKKFFVETNTSQRARAHHKFLGQNTQQFLQFYKEYNPTLLKECLDQCRKEEEDCIIKCNAGHRRREVARIRGLLINQISSTDDEILAFLKRFPNNENANPRSLARIDEEIKKKGHTTMGGRRRKTHSKKSKKIHAVSCI